MTDKSRYIEAAQQIIVSLGLPRAQQNERSALSTLRTVFWGWVGKKLSTA